MVSLSLIILFEPTKKATAITLGIGEAYGVIINNLKIHLIYLKIL
jgi:hypothetical protein